jgi:hypothetical protein
VCSHQLLHLLQVCSGLRCRAVCGGDSVTAGRVRHLGCVLTFGVPGVQDAIEKADIAGLSSAVEQLGLSNARDTADGGRSPQTKQTAEHIARQVRSLGRLLLLALVTSGAVSSYRLSP